MTERLSTDLLSDPATVPVSVFRLARPCQSFGQLGFLLVPSRGRSEVGCRPPPSAPRADEAQCHRVGGACALHIAHGVEDVRWRSDAIYGQ